MATANETVTKSKDMDHQKDRDDESALKSKSTVATEASSSIALATTSTSLMPSSETPTESSLLLLESNLSAEERRLVSLEQQVLEVERLARKRKLELREERVKRRREELNRRLEMSMAILEANEETQNKDSGTDESKVYVVVQQKNNDQTVQSLQLEDNSTIILDPSQLEVLNIPLEAVTAGEDSQLFVLNEDSTGTSPRLENSKSLILPSNAFNQQLILLPGMEPSDSQEKYLGESHSVVHSQRLGVCVRSKGQSMSQNPKDMNRSSDLIFEAQSRCEEKAILQLDNPSSDSSRKTIHRKEDLIKCTVTKPSKESPGPGLAKGSTSAELPGLSEETPFSPEASQGCSISKPTKNFTFGAESSTRSNGKELSNTAMSFSECSLESPRKAALKQGTSQPDMNAILSSESMGSLNGDTDLNRERPSNSIAKPMGTSQMNPEPSLQPSPLTSSEAIEFPEKSCSEATSNSSANSSKSSVSKPSNETASSVAGARRCTRSLTRLRGGVEEPVIVARDRRIVKNKDNNDSFKPVAKGNENVSDETRLEYGKRCRDPESPPLSDTTSVQSTVKEDETIEIVKASCNDSVSETHRVPTLNNNNEVSSKQEQLKNGENVDKSKFICGKCGARLGSIASFRLHRASRHGGLARLDYESQNFTEAEADALINDAFNRVKVVPCPTCLTKKFTTKPGMRYHRRTCGRSDEEIERLKEKCPHCDYRGIPACLRYHMTRHFMKTEKDDKESNEDKSGLRRSNRRKAALDAISNFNKNKDSEKAKGGDDSHDSFCDDDDEADEEPELVVSRKRRGRLRKPPSKHSSTFKYALCEGFSSENCRDVEFHVTSEHGQAILRRTKSSKLVRKGGVRRSVDTEADGLKPSLITVLDEKLYRDQNYHRNKFDFITENEFGEVLSLGEASKYLPPQLQSPLFNVCFDGKKVEADLRLDRFEALKHSKGSQTIFCGGPVISGSLYPDNYTKDNEDKSTDMSSTIVMALSVLRSWSDCHSSTEAYSNSQSLQIWHLDYKNEKAYGVRQLLLHDFGPVFSLHWAPSGNYLQGDQQSENRLGLLACACASGVVAIFSIPDVQSQELCLLRPSRPTLMLSCNSSHCCLDLSWFRGLNHRVIAAGMADGSVALFDLMSASKSGTTITPYERILAHESPVNTLDLSYYSVEDDPEFPANLVTGSKSDRCLSVWRLDDLGSRPTQLMNRGPIRKVQWLSQHRERLLVSCDDLSSSSFVVELGPDRLRVDHVLALPNVGVQAQDSSHWLSVSGVMGTAGGDISLFLGSRHRRSLEHHKQVARRRLLLSTIRVLKEDKNNRLIFRDCLKYEESLKHVNEGDGALLRRPDGLECENLDQAQTLNQITWVAMHQGELHMDYIASACLAGLVRVHHVKGLRDDSVRRLLQE